MIATVLSGAQEQLTYRELMLYRSNGIFNPAPMIPTTKCGLSP